jgi:hypothetical protein
MGHEPAMGDNGLIPRAILLSCMGLIGAARRSRTPNLQIRSLSLYPVELWLHDDDCRRAERKL